MFPMDNQSEALLEKDQDESYPKKRYYQYLKLLTHTFNFGRIDLYFLVFEWSMYFLYTLFSSLKIDGALEWDWGYLSAPLYVGIGTGFLRTFLCGKKSKCAVSVRIVSTPLGLINYIFLILKIGEYVGWSWHLVFIPTYASFGIASLALLIYTIWVILKTKRDYLFKFCLFCFDVTLVSIVVFVYFLSKKLDGMPQWSWTKVFTPIWIINGLFFLGGIIFVIVFPDLDFQSDNVLNGRKVRFIAIYPRYRVNFFYLISILMNIPIFIFTFLLSRNLEKEIRFVVFIPIFVAEIILLGFIACLLYARRQRGSYCIKINKGTSIPSEIW